MSDAHTEPVTPTTIHGLSDPFSVGDEAFAAVIADIGAAAPRWIVEYGSGASSVRWARAFPAAQLLAIDHDAGFAAQTQAAVDADGATNVRVEYRPVRLQRTGRLATRTYAAGWLPDQVDVAFVDGPPASIARGREGAIHQVLGRIVVGGRIYIDDYNRPPEREAVARVRLSLIHI